MEIRSDDTAGVAMHEQPLYAPYKLQALDRAFAILDLLGDSPAPVGLGEVADSLGLHKSTAHRFLMVLERHRMVDRTVSGKFRLGLRLFDYGNRAIEQYDLRECAQRHIRMLVEEVEETAHLCVLENMHMVYIDKLEPKRSVRMISRVGSSSPIHCTAVGKAILASMPLENAAEIVKRLRLEKMTKKTLITREALMQEIARTRRRGYAVDDEEREEGVRCVAVAISDAAGNPVAAISISGPVFRVTGRKLPFVVEKLMDCVKGIRKDIGYNMRHMREAKSSSG
ncbi:IclR family transcriptional regulator [Paracidobacterium acidisoli]|uniref:IclR family transcriptional regulator n=1 Tax=Paracidobacterium acidisoli TaxID=2303751 RepID=A0A372ILJ2_9BACT|nr:IclR family transcriptional regulator [Paracidobacterium acidisoli]MBT9332401.1 IclR family transcriptional regulator [Paracidobacterium acidisoli]